MLHMDEVARAKYRVQAFIMSGALTKRELAKRAGKPETTLIGMLDADWNPTADTLSRLIRVVDNVEAEGKKKVNRKARVPQVA